MHYLTDEQKKHCCYCGRTFTSGRRYTVEHLVPKSLGGNDSAYNKRACCSICNGEKGSKTVQLYVYHLRFVLESTAKSSIQYYEASIKLENAEYLLEYVRSAGAKLYRSENIYTAYTKTHTFH